MLVLPKRGVAHLAQVSEGELENLAAVLRDLIRRLESKLPAVSFNWLIHTSPFDSNAVDHYHWHVEIVPRLTRTAGYEWATGNAINTVPPETAAAELRRLS
jgi:UDPglucose--hexose-1-phosphate uridylyltransferase